MQVGNLCGEYAKGRRKSAEPDRRDALCGWYVCSYAQGYQKVIKYGAAFYRKSCLVGRCEE